jgi:hypothetical protein
MSTRDRVARAAAARKLAHDDMGPREGGVFNPPPANPARSQQGVRARQRARQQKTTVNKTRARNTTRNVTITINKGGGGVAGAGQQARGLGDINLSSSGVRAYCERGRRLFREAGESLGYAEQILRKALKETPPPAGESKAAVKARANKVGRSLKRAKYASYAASAQCVRTWAIYTREFEPWMNQLGYREQRQRGMQFGA